jgi:hypothetical protein
VKVESCCHQKEVAILFSFFSKSFEQGFGRAGGVKNDPNHEDLRKQKDTKTHFLNK